MLPPFFIRMAVLVLATSADPCYSQVQRCDTGRGVVFQQGPCASSPTQSLAMMPSPPVVVSAGPPGAGKQLCKEMATVTFGESARIVVGRRWGTEVVKFRGVRETAITYEMSIDEKTERSGYAGARPFYCFVDVQESRVFRISAPLRRQAVDSGS